MRCARVTTAVFSTMPIAFTSKEEWWPAASRHFFASASAVGNADLGATVALALGVADAMTLVPL